MTYKELAEYILNDMSADQLGMDVTLFVPGVDEYYPAVLAFTDADCDVLDENHPVLTID
jgi:hypothetical protein